MLDLLRRWNLKDIDEKNQGYLKSGALQVTILCKVSRFLAFSRKWVGNHFYMAKWTLIYTLVLLWTCWHPHMVVKRFQCYYNSGLRMYFFSSLCCSCGCGCLCYGCFCCWCLCRCLWHPYNNYYHHHNYHEIRCLCHATFRIQGMRQTEWPPFIFILCFHYLFIIK